METPGFSAAARGQGLRVLSPGLGWCVCLLALGTLGSRVLGKAVVDIQGSPLRLGKAARNKGAGREHQFSSVKGKEDAWQESAFESGAPDWSVSCLCLQTESPGTPTALVPVGQSAGQVFQNWKTSRCPWGSSKAVQVLEVLFRTLQDASLHLQAPEDVRNLSHIL